MKSQLSPETRTSLLKRLKCPENDQGWREFACLYSGLIKRLARSASLTEDEAEDVLQEVLISVARNIRDFHYDPDVSSFKRWLSNITRWRITSQIRRRIRYQMRFGDSPLNYEAPRIEEIPAPDVSEDSLQDVKWGENLLRLALKQVRAEIREKHFQIYFLRVIKEKEISEVCRQLRVNRGQVYVATLRVGRLVKAKIQELRRERV